MDIHNPKPWRSAGEFLKEIGTIVIGVLIALGAEQAVEQLHWAHEVKAARAAIRSEMAIANQKFAFRVAAEPCIARRLDALESVIEKVARREPAPHLGPVLPDIGNAFNESTWDNYRAAETLTHFDAKEMARLGTYYLQIGSMRQLTMSESDALGVLAVLRGEPSRLGAADVANLRIALQHARFDNALIASIASDELEGSKSLHLAVPAPDAERLKMVCGPLPVVGV